ncbi:PAS domain S-box protein [Candidatus Woesearchaeota archaeon]|nr:PAS domain S-box protein [Candidatus Woesearchaeota archaeon]
MKKEEEKKLRESEEKYRAIFDSIPELVVLLDKKGVVKDINNNLIELSGYSKETIIGKNILNAPFMTKSAQLKIVKNLALRMMGKKLSPYECEFKTKNRKRIIGRITGNALKINGEIVGDLVIVSDVTKERARIDELEKFHEVTLDRELKMIELKKKIKELEKKLKKKTN